MFTWHRSSLSIYLYCTWPQISMIQSFSVTSISQIKHRKPCYNSLYYSRVFLWDWLLLECFYETDCWVSLSSRLPPLSTWLVGYYMTMWHELLQFSIHTLGVTVRALSVSVKVTCVYRSSTSFTLRVFWHILSHREHYFKITNDRLRDFADRFAKTKCFA